MLKIHHFRNATFVIETAKDVILIDPMLGPKGIMPPFTLFRAKARKNPTVSLPSSCNEILQSVTHCVITHRHPDHLDTAGINFLIEKSIPVTCSYKDEKILKKKGLQIVQSLSYKKRESFLGGTIEGIPAKHGYGFVAKPMGNVMGFYIELPNQQSIYISSDTIYTSAVDEVLKTYKPQITIVAAGSAQFDLFNPVLMRMDDILTFVRNSPGKVIANHLEAINHCPTTRKGLRETLEKHGLSEKVYIPVDGEVVTF
ncbi:MBL fold metallo-hydrolase [uncultured Kordia sp.]|uniref:MBL fold metallo-hydrolase n=1 Tax=uncultured Kordia sp. TaxID=507699 RepID=UPI0026376915|nr:MBL fold metallo-hydrolase [uncultured Kordia sp.]